MSNLELDSNNIPSKKRRTYRTSKRMRQIQGKTEHDKIKDLPPGSTVVVKTIGGDRIIGVGKDGRRHGSFGKVDKSHI